MANTTYKLIDQFGTGYSIRLVDNGDNTYSFGTSQGSAPSTALAAGADAASNTFAASIVGSYNSVFNGATWDRMRGDILGLWVGLEARTTIKTGAASAATVRQIATSEGVAVTQPYQIPEWTWSYAPPVSGITNTTTAVTFLGAVAALRTYITSIQIAAGTLGAATEVAIRDGAGGTVLWRGFLPTAGGQLSHTFPIPLRGSVNTLTEVVTLTATITGAVYFNAQGFFGR